MSATSSNEPASPATSLDPALVATLAARPYRKVIRGDEVDGFLAEAPELPGCVTAGETVEEALKMLRDAMQGWIESALLAGEPVPEPEAARLPA
jgi:predicted RNase H-like HicB family nuclease